MQPFQKLIHAVAVVATIKYDCISTKIKAFHATRPEEVAPTLGFHVQVLKYCLRQAGIFYLHICVANQGSAAFESLSIDFDYNRSDKDQMNKIFKNLFHNIQVKQSVT